MTLRLLLTVYVVGGLTFVPLVVLSLFLIAYFTLPDLSTASAPEPTPDDPANLVHGEGATAKLVLKTSTDSLAEKFHRKHDSDVAAGYFAVCREYVPGGVNGRPPDKLSPAGEVIAAESPSVYQSMYRSIFDRTQKPTIEPHKDAVAADGGIRKVKRANNVFYVVLRHGHLMLYEDIQQLEVRYVISLEYHDVDIFSGVEGEDITESELWTKRNAIRLKRRQIAVGDRNPTLPFFFFSENLSEKEDFYFALLKNQEKNVKDAPSVQEFDTKDIIELVQMLHSSGEQLETRWLNALVGRLFLALYKTPFLEDVIRQKLTKKLSRVKKPNFITKLALQKIDPGHGAPCITNPRLRDLSVNGDCVAEMDVNYAGRFRIEVAATARIELGSRFKAREVDMVLAATCKKLSGRLLVRLKPQPSNRLWLSFEKMPKIEMTLEPIVSTRHITYSVILKALESRIMEVVAETLVLPYWDDVPFLNTEGETVRGGIWKKEPVSARSTEIEDEDAEDEAEAGEEFQKSVLPSLKKDDRTLSMPVMSDAKQSAANRAARKAATMSSKEAAGLSSPERSPKPPAPRMLRSTSFATAANPTLSSAHADAATPPLDIKDARKRDSMLADLNRPFGTSPTQSTPGSAGTESNLDSVMRQRTPSDTSKSSLEDQHRPMFDRQPSLKIRKNVGSSSADTLTPASPTRDPALLRPSHSTRAVSMIEKARHGTVDGARSPASTDRKQQAMNSINAAATAAQKWGLGVLARNRQRDSNPDASVVKEPAPSGSRLPMGRGQPLPPPGTPLPGPDKPGLFSMTMRKQPMTPKLPATSEPPAVESDSGSSPPPPPMPDRPERRRRQASIQNAEADPDDEVLVVEAPIESNPASPLREHHDDFFGHGEEPEEQPQEEEEERKNHIVEATPSPLPIDKAHVERASLDAATGGAIEKAVKKVLQESALE